MGDPPTWTHVTTAHACGDTAAARARVHQRWYVLRTQLRLRASHAIRGHDASRHTHRPHNGTPKTGPAQTLLAVSRFPQGPTRRDQVGAVVQGWYCLRRAAQVTAAAVDPHHDGLHSQHTASVITPKHDTGAFHSRTLPASRFHSAPSWA